ncbi:hypothetical protein OIO90_001702 [Microbotryomycetes sp. JL221]|nr:hypothetical protein OIO90_001702 [Microbotryomycetes sp. JL221]
MKAFAVAATLLPALAMALPMNDGKKYDDHGKEVKDDGSWHDKSWGGWDQSGKGLADNVFHFTSTYKAYATPDQIINNNQTAVPGEPGAYGWFQYGIYAPDEIICWNITVFISGDYQSPAKTATHIHEAPFGRAGPPRLAFPNPTGDSPIDEFGRRTSFGCMQGPFTTGLDGPDGNDTGTGFSLSQIEANPPAFFTDTHTTTYVAGAIRGQLELSGTTY